MMGGILLNERTNEPLISVIVPVYNSENYLHRCVDSILKQTYSNLEIILIDDGSKDLSGTICDAYAAKDIRIQVIHQRNMGVSAARNSGLDIARGTYITFVDSDDYILPTMYETMLTELQKTAVDICVCQWQYENLDGTWVVDLSNVDESIYGKKDAIAFAEYLYRGSYENGVVVGVCNKLYKSELFDKIRFKGRMYEDDLINSEILSRDITVNVLKEQFYVYTQNLSSLTNGAFNTENLAFLDTLVYRSTLFAESDFIANETRKLYCNLYVEYYFKLKQSGIIPPTRKDFDTIFRMLRKNRWCDLKFYTRMWLFQASPYLYGVLLKLKR